MGSYILIVSSDDVLTTPDIMPKVFWLMDYQSEFTADYWNEDNKRDLRARIQAHAGTNYCLEYY